MWLMGNEVGSAAAVALSLRVLLWPYLRDWSTIESGLVLMSQPTVFSSYW